VNITIELLNQHHQIINSAFDDSINYKFKEKLLHGSALKWLGMTKGQFL